jgi:hypothetical protein
MPQKQKTFVHIFLALTSASILAVAGTSLTVAQTHRSQTHPSQSQPVVGFDVEGNKPVVMVVGTFHFAGSTSDMVQFKQEDILSPQRQSELRRIIDKLKQFKPTKIVVEVEPSAAPRFDSLYARYVAGTDTLKRNEIYQVGFRMAKELGHQRLYYADFKQDMDFDTLFASATKYNQTSIIKRIEAWRKNTEELLKKQAAKPLTEQLCFWNDEANLAHLHRIYALQMEIGRDGDYVGADVVGGWHVRNLKIATNIFRLANASNDRLLVLFGSGHKVLLDAILRESPSIELVQPASYLK